MWIQPNTTLKILKNVPLDNQYENTMWFLNDTDQYSAFNRYVKYTFQNPPSALTYQRVNRNTIRVNKLCDDLYDCNYLMFQNTAYGQKWFYAFILQVNYINDNVTEVVYEIDEIQTWLGIIIEGNLEECFIERQHSVSDNVGDNLQPENVSLGEYKLTNFGVPSPFIRSNTVIVMALAIEFSSANLPVPRSAANCYRGLFTGFEYKLYPNTIGGAALVKQDLNYLTSQIPSKIDYVMNIFVAPKYLTFPRKSDDTESIDYWIVGESDTAVSTVDYRTNKRISGAIDGYTPRNKKLYTYPYNFLYVTNFQGVGKPFPYEYFNTPNGGGYTENQCVFSFSGDLNGNVTITATPMYYKGEENNQDEMISASGYPQCGWNADTYKAWIAQAKGLGALALAGVGMAAGFGALGAVGSAVSMNEFNKPVVTEYNALPGPAPRATPQPNLAMDISKGALNTLQGYGEQVKTPALALTVHALSKGFNAFVNPIEQRGNQSGSALLADDCLGFGVANKHITAEYAARIDAFFDMYGYAQNIVAKPNIMCREHWTYVKTIGCTLTGELPVDSAKKIGQIFDNGIRFWRDINHIGEYSYYATNNPVIA